MKSMVTVGIGTNRVEIMHQCDRYPERKRYITMTEKEGIKVALALMSHYGTMIMRAAGRKLCGWK